MLRAFGADLFGEQWGDPPARVLALPGWMRQRSDFRGVLDGLDAIALDLPGFGGASAAPEHAMGAVGYADAVTPALGACGPRPILLGHSFGGRVAVHLAARHPDRFAALVLTGAPLLHRANRPAGPPLSFRLLRQMHRVHLIGDTRMEAIRQRRGSADYRNATGVMRSVLVTVVNESYEDQLAQVRCPVELVWGADDDAVPVSVAERAAALVPNGARITVIPGAGHLTPITAPDALRDALVRHL